MKSKIPLKEFKRIVTTVAVFILFFFIFICIQIYVPANPISHANTIFTVQKGMGDTEIANSLQKLGIIRSNWFFRLYVVASLQHTKLQAGRYDLSARMSTYQIAKKMATGDTIQDKAVILEGWDVRDIGKYMQEKGICTQKEFIAAAKKDYSKEFDFLKDKPTDIGVEGFLFPDTYDIAKGQSCDDLIVAMLSNFDKKLTPDLRAQITKQKKTIFDITTMASMIEKEVKSMSDKKIVSGIMWKRISIGMPLQLDCTVNYITDRNDPSVTIKATKIDSPYNTYMYYGLPKGPISNPGIDSINAAIYPQKTSYLFWLSDGTTHFSQTLDQHNEAKAKYLD
jgi:UPF0755 protein